MKLSWRTGIALVIGGILLGGSLSALGQSEDGGSPEDNSRTSESRTDGRGPKDPGPHFFGRGVVRSEALVEDRDEEGQFNTVKMDRGILRSIDGTTLVIEEADGTSVDIQTSDETRMRRDGEEAEVDDLEVGDHVAAHRVQEGDGDFVTRHVMAISEEQYAEMEAKRAACEDDDPDTECERPGRHGPGRRGPGGERR